MNRMDLVEKIAEKNAISKAEANRILGTVIEEVMAAAASPLRSLASARSSFRIVRNAPVATPLRATPSPSRLPRSRSSFRAPPLRLL